MSKLHPRASRDVLKILLDNGFERVSEHPTGSHVRLGKYINEAYKATTVQMNRKEIPVWVLHKIIRQTGKPVEEFF